MLFGWKTPLSRNLSADDLLRAKKSDSGSGAFLGASLFDRGACRLSIAPGALIRVTGHLETYAPNIANLIAKEAIPQRLSMLLLDFQQTEEYWHRLWAAAFNLDRAKDFRLIDLTQEERSDYLGPNAPQGLPEPAYLKKSEQAFSVGDHLRQHKGLVATIAGKDQQDVLWSLGKDWLSAADMLLVFGWDELTAERRKVILEAQRASGSQRLIVVQSQFAAEAQTLPQATEIMFEQKSAMPAHIWSKLREANAAEGMEKVLAKTDASLVSFSMIQCLVLHNARLDLVQTGTGDGLPWPPDYRPLRLRYPGN